MSDYETILYEEGNGVAWVTLNRPEAHNAFNTQMREELQAIWTGLRRNDDVRCAVLTGAGEKAFCVGLDREDVHADEDDPRVAYPTPWMFDDPAHFVGPKACDLWKPVIAAVNGMACGGAFYMLGEVEFVIAAEHATFFDPHVTYGMTAAFEPIKMLQKMPFQEVMRLTLLGNSERMTAERAHQIGFVSEVVPGDQLRETVAWAAESIAANPALATGGSVRALWMGLDLSRRQALDLASLYTYIGTDPDAIKEGQARFLGSRPEWRKR